MWGGCSLPDTGPRVCDPSVVYLHLCGKWMEKNTSGNAPVHSMYATATIMDDKMFVLGGFIHQWGLCMQGIRDENSVYFLDLKNLVWKKLNPSGITPNWIGVDIGMAKLESWPYEGKIYVFGGGDTAKQLICYNISTNEWESVMDSGDIPSVRNADGSVVVRDDTSIILRDDTIFLFGGGLTYGDDPYRYLNDLYILNPGTKNRHR